MTAIHNGQPTLVVGHANRDRKVDKWRRIVAGNEPGDKAQARRELDKYFEEHVRNSRRY